MLLRISYKGSTILLTITPKMPERRVFKPRAALLGTYPSSLAICWTRLTVSCEMAGCPRNALETVV
jgi:hypothetical protein